VNKSPLYAALAIFTCSAFLVSLSCSSPAATTTTSPRTTTPPATTGATSYTVNVASKAGLGNYLVDGKGTTLYWTTRDAVGKSNISGTTLANWPAFSAASIAVPAALKAADFGSITRTEGGSQVSYKGWPVYYFVKDTAAGETLGQGVGGVWSVIDPAAAAPALVPTVTITAPASAGTIPSGNVTVSISVTNFNVVDKQGQTSAPGEGHVHFYLDIPARTEAGKPAVPPSGVWAHVSGTTYTFTDVAPGTHTITVQLVNNDHTPLIPLATAQATVTVGAAAASPATTAPASTSAPAAQPQAIKIASFAFSPASVTVDVGTKVTWTNSDTAGHSVTSDTGLFNSPTFGNGETFSFTFTASGTYAYHCSIHPSMKGTVTVQ
jgi:plastocyanin/predicted lipoprotein with Yx(FWY)xxD motif